MQVDNECENALLVVHVSSCVETQVFYGLGGTSGFVAWGEEEVVIPRCWWLTIVY